MESSVHVIIAVRQLIFVSHHSHIKWLEIDGLDCSFAVSGEKCILFLCSLLAHLSVGHYRLSDSHDSEIVATELVRAIVSLFILKFTL